MSFSSVIVLAAIVGAALYDWRVSAHSPAPYTPQGLLWVDESAEQTTWWGDGAIIQSTH